MRVLGFFGTTIVLGLVGLTLLTSLSHRARAESTPSAASVTARYDRGLLVSSADEQFAVRLSAWGAFRFTFHSVEDRELARDNTYAFSVPRARLTIDGHLFGPTLRYRMDVGFGEGIPALKDFNVEWRALPGDLHLTVGQFKRPWSREHLAQLSAAPFADTSRTGADFYAGRDLGLMLHNGLMESPSFEWAIALMNGTDITPRLVGATVDAAGVATGGDFVTSPRSFKPALFLRVGYNHNGAQGYRFSDHAKGPFRWSIALSAMAMLDTEDSTQSVIGTQADLLVQFRGLSVSAAGYVTSHQTGQTFGDRNWERAGFNVHAGYLIGPNDWTVRPELVARYAQVAERSGIDVQEGNFGVNVFIHGARIRWTTDASVAYRFPRLVSGGADTVDYQVRTQLGFTL